MKKLPLARTRDLLVQNTDRETLIYDLLIDKAYCLNETSSLVYQACNGKTTFEELKIKTGFTDDVIYLALDGLQKQNFIEDQSEYVSPFSGISRREVVRKIGLTSMIALPVISSIIAPTAIRAASNCAAEGETCNSALPYDTQNNCCTTNLRCRQSTNKCIQCLERGRPYDGVSGDATGTSACDGLSRKQLCCDANAPSNPRYDSTTNITGCRCG